MGLDRGWEKVFNKIMEKLPHSFLGFSAGGGVKGLLSRWFGRKQVERTSPESLEQRQFEADVKEQLLQLKKKGLSIPVFTL